MFATAWVGTFVMNHLVNLCFPAMSPRIFIADQFQNELRGVWLLGVFRNAVTKAAASTYSAFPSGHCGLSVLAAILSFRIGLHKSYSYLVLLTTVLIVLATQVLRYHYFVDFLFSLPLVCFGTWMGGFHDKEVYQRSLTEMGEEEHDEDGKPMSTPGDAEIVPLIRSGSGVDESPDVELGRINPPLALSANVFGMTRSLSSHQMRPTEEEAGEKAI